jgi:hypothetical protein
VLSVKVGVPVTTTGSLKVIVTLIVCPALYDPFAVVALTFVTVGAVTSVAQPIEMPASGVAPAKMLFELVIVAIAVAAVTSVSQAVLLIVAVAPEFALCAQGAIVNAPL